MPSLEWNGPWSAGVGTIDGVHAQLVSMANEPFEAMRTAKGKDVLGKILDGLITDAKTRVAREEALLHTKHAARRARGAPRPSRRPRNGPGRLRPCPSSGVPGPGATRQNRN